MWRNRPTQRGEVITIFNQYAYVPNVKMIHSSIQLESFKNNVDNKSMKVKGTQTIISVEGYVIP